jgi:hypothetical protein
MLYVTLFLSAVMLIGTNVIVRRSSNPIQWAIILAGLYCVLPLFLKVSLFSL